MLPQLSESAAAPQHFPHVKSYVRAHDVNHGLVLEKAGATAVVPETLEPSLQARPFCLLLAASYTAALLERWKRQDSRSAANRETPMTRAQQL